MFIKYSVIYTHTYEMNTKLNDRPIDIWKSEIYTPKPGQTIPCVNDTVILL